MKKDPIHLAIIPDGNRRWAHARGLLPWNGHEHAVENFRSLTGWCKAHPRISVLTLWCFSTENWKRDPKEVTKLMTIFENYLRRERKMMLEDGVRLIHSGRTDRIPASLKEILTEAQSGTGRETDFTLHLALDYGGRDEVVRAVGRLAVGEEVTEASIRMHLDHPEIQDIDIILRTGGEQRTSNFFLWQSTYAEWIFTEKHFPSLTPDDLAAAVAEFERRNRRFGGG